MGLGTKNCWEIYPKENGEMRLKVGWKNPKRVIKSGGARDIESRWINEPEIEKKNQALDRGVIP